MKNPISEPWQSLDELAKNTKAEPTQRTAAAIALVALYRFILGKTERVGDRVPSRPNTVDNVDKNDLST